jgi:3-ketosteroid 9alpha-monooxygenase subunit B
MTDTAVVNGRALELEVIETLHETANSVSLLLVVVAGERSRLSYRPGQFLTLRIPREDGGAVARCYSIASSPYCDEELKVTVKRTAGGFGSSWLCDNARCGLRIEALPPSGSFVPRSLEQDLLLIAGGSGITPIISILKSAIARGRGRIVLIYSNHDEPSAIFARELRELAAAHCDRLTIIHWFTAQRGRLITDQLRTLTSPLRSYDAFICGPPGLMSAAEDALRANGMLRDRINTEVFSSLAGDPFTAGPLRTPPQTMRSAVQVEIDLYGATHHLTWQTGVVLLDLMLDSGLDAPYSCREGVCGTCTCLLKRGRVRMKRDDVIDPSDLANGYVLACQAVADGVDVHIAF